MIDRFMSEKILWDSYYERPSNANLTFVLLDYLVHVVPYILKRRVEMNLKADMRDIKDKIHVVLKKPRWMEPTGR